MLIDTVCIKIQGRYYVDCTTNHVETERGNTFLESQNLPSKQALYRQLRSQIVLQDII